ncbi:MAG: hypothetical protein IJ930_03165 [Lachnospiraceae bacterium]|nr:hypothetical protein [Lachnospiraceae bacterium]
MNNGTKNEKALINISVKTFIQVTLLLVILMAAAIIMTYIVPKGSFGTLPDGSTDYASYTVRNDIGGIPLPKGIFAPLLVFTSADGLSLIMLSLFLLVISASFQVMNDAGGVRALIGSLSERFRDRAGLLIIVISFTFMCFGAFLGLFEEMLTMLPIVCALCVLTGFDSFTGFLISIVSCGFGFASAITNPFTVLLASGIIGVNPMHHIWYRIIIFAVMYLLLLGFIFLYIRKLHKDPASGLTAEHDRKLKESASLHDPAGQPAPKRTRITYAVFLLAALALIIISSALPSLRGYTVVILLAYFLFFGLAAGMISTGSPRTVFSSFAKGFTGALPTLVFICMAASIRYIFDEGSIMPTIVHRINGLARERSIYAVALIVYLIVLVLEFFISSSTAKAIFIMGILSVADIGLSKSMSVLIYTFADGYTNIVFPTSPVLLIALSMIEVDYLKWVKKSLPLFIVNFVLVLSFIFLGIAVNY